MPQASYSWAHPGVRVICINDTPDNGRPLPIRRGEQYTIIGVKQHSHVSASTVSLNISDKPNEFWLDRFEPFDPAVHL